MGLKVLYEKCPPERSDLIEILKNKFDKYLEHLADIQAGISLKVDKPMLIDEVDQVVAPGRRRVRDELVKPGVYRLRAFRQYRRWYTSKPDPSDYEYCFVLDVTKQGILGSEFQSEIWFESATTLEHILRMQFAGVIEIDRDNWLPGTTKITYTRNIGKGD